MPDDATKSMTMKWSPEELCARGANDDVLSVFDRAIDATPTGKPQSLPALKVQPVSGVLPFVGARNPMSRSNVAHRVSMTIATPAAKWVPRIFHFESEREYAVAIDALITGHVFELEVQLPPFPYKCPHGGQRKNPPQHYFDLRLTLHNGFRRGIYVKNRKNLLKPSTQDEIKAIIKAAPATIADDIIIVDGDDYTRPYLENLGRFWAHLNLVDPEADEEVEYLARTSNYWFVSDLLAKTDLSGGRAYRAVSRLIARNVLWADRYAVICRHSRIVLNT